ncbi:hypothetical protein Vadar_015642 [Vaccinium darrowii]|uniref:Uncharacterized protein n=1 Tax=Vaccinium darrowii TaxID=229202 RepID=A0ACB7YLR8_9ERIC|nr:hypothetical protein Vadar_015642 [Vaccinium darrowii]
MATVYTLKNAPPSAAASSPTAYDFSYFDPCYGGRFGCGEEGFDQGGVRDVGFRGVEGEVDDDLVAEGRRGHEETENRLSHYLPLLKATIKGDWNEASGIIDQDPDAVRTRITQLDEAALTVAIFSRGRNPFVRKLLEKMTPEDVVNLVNDRGSTALHFAAGTGNIEGAKMLVNKNSELPNVPNELGLIPLNYAAAWGFRKMVLYLQKVTREDMILARGHRILIHLTVGELYDIAFSLVQRDPKLACVELRNPLEVIVEKYSSFQSGNSFNFWQKLIYLG